MKPRNLYRYIKIDDHLDSLLLENKLYFSNPANFNDPLELQAKFIFSGEENDYPEFKRYMEGVTGNKNKLPEFSDFIQELESLDFQKMNMQMLSKNAVENWRIACLSEQRAHNIMFALYSENHSGLCLIFNTEKDDDLFKNNHLIPVNYAENIIEVDLLHYSQKEHQIGCWLSGSKQREWCYEKEWRLIVRKDDNETDPKLVEFNPECLTGMIFGLRVNVKNREKIKTILKKRNLELDVFESYITYNSYQLGIRKVQL